MRFEEIYYLDFQRHHVIKTSWRKTTVTGSCCLSPNICNIAVEKGGNTSEETYANQTGMETPKVKSFKADLKQ